MKITQIILVKYDKVYFLIETIVLKPVDKTKLKYI